MKEPLLKPWEPDLDDLALGAEGNLSPQ